MHSKSFTGSSAASIDALDAIRDAGNAVTDVFALFLRRLGCEVIVFPSARCDNGVVFNDGAIVDFWGWNAVDFRGAPLPTRVAPELETTLERLGGVNHFAEVMDGPRAGSLSHLGNSLYAKIENEDLYRQYVAMHSPIWRHQHLLERHCRSERGEVRAAVTAKKRISKIHWDSIVRGIDKGLTVPFLGAGVNAGGKDYQGFQRALRSPAV
jgi:hypothetical protein